jgi:hypothetical protein
MSSAIVVPVISEAALANFAKLSASSPCDNVLLEHRLALELQARGKVRYVMPLFRGNFNFGTVYPTATVEAVEAATARHVRKGALTLSTRARLSILHLDPHLNGFPPHRGTARACGPR